ncbi:porphobilinogen synthase [Hyphobacterium sp. CCMP332]|nr:porphobilinogen synthase [Hyphobacterium sp. CCMP332]
MNYPTTRNRRLRQSNSIRALSREHSLSPDDFIVPVFIEEGKNQKNEITSMPGYYRYSLDTLKTEINLIKKLGLKSVLLFVKVPDHKKDNFGKEALNSDGLMQQSIKMIKDLAPELCVMTDVAMDPYSEFGHDGLVENKQIVNDPSNKILANMALSHAQAGADFVAPSDMMDGRVKMIREKLEVNQFHNTGILAYSAKYASCFYGPFRDALDSAPGFGDKKTYQMDPANSREAVKEAQMDQLEGADILMVKPAGPYLDIISKVKENTQLPIAAYQVSGEYAMIKAAAKQGWLNEKYAMLESVLGIKRAGADMIASYFAKEIVKEIL